MGRLDMVLIIFPELRFRTKRTLGGTMYIVPGEQIVLLKAPYVFAEFEDGHIGGTMLLEYMVTPGSKVLWKRLWAVQE